MYPFYYICLRWKEELVAENIKRTELFANTESNAYFCRNLK
jgi:hypothetical protein